MRKKMTQMNLDMYIFIKEYTERNGYCPSYREIAENTNYKSVASVQPAIAKMIELNLLTAGITESGNIKARTIRVIDNEETRQLINEFRSNYE